jgi:DNA invertase Pin-like site-specific DNA recombinase
VRPFCNGNIQTRRALRQGFDRRSGADYGEPATAAPGGRWTAWLDGRDDHRDEGISGSLRRQKRPGLDALLKGVARREFDIVAAWSVCRLGRSLSDLIGLLGKLRSRHIDLYLHRHALDTSTPSGRMLFGMLGVFSEFERAMVRDRVMAGLDRARSSGKRLGRPRTTPFEVQRIRLSLDEGPGVRETARLLKISAAKVSEVRRMSAAKPSVRKKSLYPGDTSDMNLVPESGQAVDRPRPR